MKPLVVEVANEIQTMNPHVIPKPKRKVLTLSTRENLTAVEATIMINLVRSLFLEIFYNYDETKSKEEKNKKNESKKKTHRGQSVLYRSW